MNARGDGRCGLSPFLGKKVARCGEWPSPIQAASLAGGSLRLDAVAIDGERICWLEGRPGEGGRCVLVCREPDGRIRDLTPPPFNVRTRVHEYGGGSFLVKGGRVWFTNFTDQRLYRQEADQPPLPLTAAGPHRYADMQLDARRERLVCVRETHPGGGAPPANALVEVPLAGGEVRVLHEGHDFYASPALSPDAGWLAWMTWDHPHMPWDESIVWLARCTSGGALGEIVRVAGGEGVSVYQPGWSEDGTLHLVCDRNGWWNLYRWQGGALSAVHEARAELARPQWQLGTATYGFTGSGEVVFSRCDTGRWRLLRLDAGGVRALASCADLRTISDLAVQGERCVLLGGAPRRPESVLLVDTARDETTVLREASPLALDPAHLSIPEAVEFPTGGGERAHAFFYPPANAEYAAPEGELPPLIVKSHGGPTGAASTTLDLRTQFWTSRGFAVLDVDYRGSSGYGRAYRDRLKGAWGRVDVEDCVNAALHLAAQGRADPRRLAIRGGSAGGFTTLCALAFHDVFKAGASYYGISDLEALARDTHKFESHYLGQLVGPYPEQAARYRRRSPIHALDGLSCPVIFFQGLEDEVVPPDQTERMVQALRDKGLAVACLFFEGEQHGFRRAGTIVATLEAELCFYGRVFGFRPVGELPAITIENL